ncbi:MAG: rhodanese-like domain-containing protein [Candidatus Lernaella stagnicola]|nr:rhodanese-like domain-containing protein [Candidatus Lernaella stagnicola]
MKKLFLLLLVAMMAAAIGCSNSSAIRDASLEEFHAALASDDTLVVDVRVGLELGGDLIFLKDAKQIPLTTLEVNLQKIPKERNIYVVGAKPEQATKAANILTKAGYPFVFRVNGTLTDYATKFDAEGRKYLK